MEAEPEYFEPNPYEAYEAAKVELRKLELEPEEYERKLRKIAEQLGI